MLAGGARLGCAAALLALILAMGGVARATEGPKILTGDVIRFYQIYDAAGGHPTAEQLDRDYLAPGSDGLHQFAKLRRVTGAAMADAIAKRPEIYVRARACLAVLPGVKQRLSLAFDKLAGLYPEAKFPPVTILVGRGHPVGITDPTGVDMGLEALCDAGFMNPNLEDRFVHTIAHEYGHIQQASNLQVLAPGMPGVTVLQMSLIEGGAEFIADLISGDVGNYQFKTWTEGREAAIEAAFVRDEDKTDASDWIDNGVGTPDKPGDLGYWVGYRIVKSYYDHAADKHQALKDIFDLSDPKAFVARSGWTPAR